MTIFHYPLLVFKEKLYGRIRLSLKLLMMDHVDDKTSLFIFAEGTGFSSLLQKLFMYNYKLYTVLM